MLVGDDADRGLLGNQPARLAADQAPRAAGLTPPSSQVCVDFLNLIRSHGTVGFGQQLQALSTVTIKTVLKAISGKITCFGTIKKIFARKGFGYITPDGGGEDIFVHVKGIPGQCCYQVGDASQCTLEWDECRGKVKGTHITAVAS